MTLSKKIFTLLLLLSGGAAAYAADFDRDSSCADFGGRIAASVEKKLFKGCTAAVSEEVRFYDDFSSFTRSYTAFGVDYKLAKWLKAGLVYNFIAVAPDDAEVSDWDIRHRFQGSLTGSYRNGLFKASLREMVQMTHRTGSFNEFQRPRNAWVLRSRVKASYGILGTPWEPFLACELNNTLNAVKYDSLAGNVKGATTNSVTYGDAFVSRIRLQAGTEYYINKRNVLDFYLMFDMETDRKVDASRYGVPKEYVQVKTNVFTIGVNYNFSWK